MSTPCSREFSRRLSFCWACSCTCEAIENIPRACRIRRRTEDQGVCSIMQGEPLGIISKHFRQYAADRTGDMMCDGRIFRVPPRLCLPARDLAVQDPATCSRRYTSFLHEYSVRRECNPKGSILNIRTCGRMIASASLSSHVTCPS